MKKALLPWNINNVSEFKAVLQIFIIRLLWLPGLYLLLLWSEGRFILLYKWKVLSVSLGKRIWHTLLLARLECFQNALSDVNRCTSILVPRCLSRKSLHCPGGREEETAKAASAVQWGCSLLPLSRPNLYFFYPPSRKKQLITLQGQDSWVEDRRGQGTY